MDQDLSLAIKSPTKRSKYGAERVVIDGIKFASKKEARRYGQLKLLEKGGALTDLKLQQRIKCIVHGDLVTTYIADFTYYCRDRKTIIYEDVKGFKTDVYKLKKKLVKACTGIDIIEV